MDWTEKQECVLCDKGGNLLVCSVDGCPISVHKSCMGCKASFDNKGNFSCPYCVYKQITAETSRLREKVMLNKKNLSTFLDENVKDDNQKEPIVDMAEKVDEISLKEKLADEKKRVSDDVSNRDAGLEKRQQSKTRVPCDETRETLEKTDMNTCMIMVLYEPKSNPVEKRGLNTVSCKEDKKKGDKLESDVSKEKNITYRKRSRLVKSNDYEKRRKEECVKEDLEDAAEILVTIHRGTQLQSKPDRKNDNDNDNSASLLNHQNGAKKESLRTKTSDPSIKKTNNTSNPELKDSSKQVSVNDDSMILRLQVGKHRVLWSEEEEDMLKEGVQKFSAVTRKNLPWKKILDFGRHVFDPSRNPSDLKDKWRNLAKQN